MSKTAKDEIISLLTKNKNNLTYNELGGIVDKVHTLLDATRPPAHTSKKYTFTVNYDLSLKEYIHAGNYKSVADEVSHLYLSTEKKGRKKIELFILSPYGCNLQTIEELMREKNLRHATARELLSFFINHKSYEAGRYTTTAAHGTYFNDKVLGVEEAHGHCLKLSGTGNFYNHYHEFACVKI